MSQTFARLQQQLGPSCQRLDRQRQQLAARAGVTLGVELMPKLAIGLVLGFLGATVIGGQTPFSPWLLPLALPLVPAGAALASWLAQRRARTEVYDAALALDRVSEAKDRVSAAVEFADAEARGQTVSGAPAFLAAAVQDGETWAARHQDVPVQEAWTPPTPAWRRAIFAVLIALLPALLPPPTGAGPDGVLPETAQRPGIGPDTEPATAAQTDADRGDADRPAATRETNPAKPAEAPPLEQIEQKASTTRAESKGGLDAKAADTAAAPTEAGEPKPARSGAGASGSQGGGGQGQSSESTGEENQEQKAQELTARKQRPQRPKPQSPRDDNKAETESAPTPSGPSRGGGQMAAVGNQKSGQDRGQEREDDPELDEEEIEDEKEESEQRGGVMPMGRDRQTPPARELSISGEGPPQDGRGGPTPPKKARGTASLVLGIQLPDHVRGLPNPGTAKTSIERTPPHGEPHALRPQQAAASGAASHVMGIERRSPYADVVRRYHELWKDQPAGPAAPKTESENR